MPYLSLSLATLIFLIIFSNLSSSVSTFVIIIFTCPVYLLLSVLACNSFNFVEKYGWPKIIHQFTLKILFLIKNLLKVTLFSVKIL
ncbi:hypothetical protein [Spiroplasma endosymbiont of Amphimallon solstitiale]|uniref:hypothetical protein n=1 Tax=Spiroplasma endosymbiont of Amphimallon solstitiale TaxID=3066288 RepID=UPI00313B5A68